MTDTEREQMDQWDAEDFEAFAGAYNEYRRKVNAETQEILDRGE